MRIIGPREIEEIRKKRTELEVRVARGIGDCITECCHQPLRDAIRVLLVEILGIPAQTLDRLLAEKSKAFAMFASGDAMANALGMKLLKIQASGLPLSVCSDVIRLFGELAENQDCKNLTGSMWAQHERAKDKLKPEPTYLKPEDAVKKGWAPLAGRTGHAEDLFGHRRRIDLEKKKLPITRSEEPYDEIPTEIKRGVDKFKFEQQSVINVIDRTFGAEPKGADVSGTTTDSMYALKHAAHAAGLDQYLSLLQLLPIATMVPAGHHSLIECAYPLSRWGHIDYHIGYYDTLMPKVCAGRARAALGGALGAVQAEADRLHVLVYWSDSRNEAALMMEGAEDVQEFKKVARLLSAYGWCVTGGLSRQLLANVLSIYSPNLLRKYPGHIPLVPGA